MAGDASRENGRKYGGRKKGAASIAAEMFRNELAKKIEAESQEWLNAIKDTALGHYVMQKTKDGDVRVYKKSPDPQAWEKALDRAFGKAPQSLQHSFDEDALSTIGDLLTNYENGGASTENEISDSSGDTETSLEQGLENQDPLLNNG